MIADMAAFTKATVFRRLTRSSTLAPRLNLVAAASDTRQRRNITNATKIDYIPDLHTVPRVEGKPGGWHPTLVHSSGEVKWTVIRLQPDGGEVPIHYHNKVWDYFMPIEGEAVIETTSKDGVKKDYEMKPGAFLACGPGDVHRVRNKSKDKEFVFFIAQAPRHQYDFVGK